jgi:hypothetical protein
MIILHWAINAIARNYNKGRMPPAVGQAKVVGFMAQAKKTNRKKAALFDSPWALPAFFLAVAATALLWQDAGTAIRSTLAYVTEGNSTAKSIVFLLLMAGLLGVRAKPPKFAQKQNPERIGKLFAIAVAAAMLWGLALNWAFIARFGGGANAFVSHVSDCGGQSCWEGTYIQHNHVTKTAIYAVEKFTGVSVGPAADDGKPLYDVIPWAGLAAPVTLFAFLCILCLGGIAVASQRKAGDALVLSAATALFAIACIDGGIFTITAINAVGLSAAFLLKKAVTDGSRMPALAVAFGPLVAASFVASIPNLFWGSQLHFAGWQYAVVAICAAYALVDSRKRLERAALAITALACAYWFCTQAYGIYAGQQVVGADPAEAAAAFAGAAGSSAPMPLLTVYGLPEGLQPGEVATAIPQAIFGSYEKYGWYFAGTVLDAPATATTSGIQAELRRKYPGGYLYAEYHPAYNYARDAYVVWDSESKAAADGWDENSLFAAKALYAKDYGTYSKVSVLSVLTGPALALEVGSYVKSKGSDAIVITTIT